MSNAETPNLERIDLAARKVAAALEGLALALEADLEIKASLSLRAAAHVMRKRAPITEEDAFCCVEASTRMPHAAFDEMRTVGTKERANAQSALDSGTLVGCELAALARLRLEG